MHIAGAGCVAPRADQRRLEWLRGDEPTALDATYALDLEPNALLLVALALYDLQHWHHAPADAIANEALAHQLSFGAIYAVKQGH